MPQIIFGTSNPKKIEDLKVISNDTVEVLSLADIDVAMPDVVENGDTFESNARKKYDTLRPLVPDEYILATEDSGLEINALGNEPGVYSRRWNPERSEMTDEALIDKTIHEMQGKVDRTARFVSAFAFGGAGLPAQELRGELMGEILEQADEANRIPGMPYRAVFYVSAAKMMMQEMIDTPLEKRLPHKTHREVAWLKLLEVIARK
jgi:XTP/dITP diphosphohydrolase